MIQIAPSLLSANFNHMGRDVDTMQKAGADLLHFDVMDGMFVPNISFGLPVLSSLDSETDMPIDVHLMIVEPHRYVERFAKAGADYITIHVEAESRIQETLRIIRECGAIPAISVKPNTPVKAIEPYLDQVGMVLVMSVEPGFGGQSFMPVALKKIEQIRHIADRQGHSSLHIEVDGGIDRTTGRQVIDAGADILVAGSALFKAEDPANFVRDLKEYAGC